MDCSAIEEGEDDDDEEEEEEEEEEGGGGGGGGEEEEGDHQVFQYTPTVSMERISQHSAAFL